LEPVLHDVAADLERGMVAAGDHERGQAGASDRLEVDGRLPRRSLGAEQLGALEQRRWKRGRWQRDVEQLGEAAQDALGIGRAVSKLCADLGDQALHESFWIGRARTVGEGYILGGGLEISMARDLVLCAESCGWAMPEVDSYFGALPLRDRSGRRAGVVFGYQGAVLLGARARELAHPFESVRTVRPLAP
jgi:hypothetical protein